MVYCIITNFATPSMVVCVFVFVIAYIPLGEQYQVLSRKDTLPASHGTCWDTLCHHLHT